MSTGLANLCFRPSVSVPSGLYGGSRRGKVHPVSKPGRCAVLVLLCASLAATGETLQQLLISQNIPLASFTPTELAETVHSSVASDPQRLLVAYQQWHGGMVSSTLQLLQYNKIDRTLLRANAAATDGNLCSGAIEETYIIAGFTLVATAINPSAECLRIFDKNLHLRQTLYGFRPVQVDANLLIIQENTIHFAPVHPARLQSVDLLRGVQREVYPPAGDKLRQRLIAENAASMPAPEVCARMNDPCRPELFDEDIAALATDGKGNFAFVARQSANHALAAEQEPITVAQQVVLYVYRRSPGGWRYCEEAIPSGEESSEEKSLSTDLPGALARCTTLLPVAADDSTAGYNPFLKRNPGGAFAPPHP